MSCIHCLNIVQIVDKNIGFHYLAGNHDIGYGSDMTRWNVDRFEREFGPINFSFKAAGHLFVGINSMGVDKCTDESLHQQVWMHVLNQSRVAAEENLKVILLTHIPFHKPAGVCADAPGYSQDSR